jgi:hypothetical protein
VSEVVVNLLSWLGGGSSNDNGGSDSVSDADIVRVVRSTGCSHIQQVLSRMSDQDIAEMAREGQIDDVLRTIDRGTAENYEAASSEPDARGVIAKLFGW